MKTKHCPLCGLDLPREAFTSTRAKYCNSCKRIRQLEQQKEMQRRAFERTKVKKQKTKGVIRVSDLKKEVQKHFNRYIRLRDEGKMCISCGKREISHAGHYIAQGSTGALRYHEDNVNGQCVKCNVWDHGNLINYRIGLVKKIGEDRVQWLEDHRNDVKKWQREELNELMDKYKQKIKEL